MIKDKEVSITWEPVKGAAVLVQQVFVSKDSGNTWRYNAIADQGPMLPPSVASHTGAADRTRAHLCDLKVHSILEIPTNHRMPHVQCSPKSTDNLLTLPSCVFGSALPVANGEVPFSCRNRVSG